MLITCVFSPNPAGAKGSPLLIGISTESGSPYRACKVWIGGERLNITSRRVLSRQKQILVLQHALICNLNPRLALSNSPQTLVTLLRGLTGGGVP
jgi:hypothetical protein